MIVIICAGSWQLIDCPQDPEEAWELAERLTTETGIPHSVARM